MYTDLTHLSRHEIETLMLRYYNGESVSKLLKEYQLSIRAAQLYKLFPPETFHDDLCEYCQVPLIRNRESKSASSWACTNNSKYCPVCHHKPYSSYCRCSNCINKEVRLEEEQRQKIKEMYSQSREPIDFNNLSFEQKVFLGALCRGLCDESLFQVKPLIGAGVRLTPSPDLTDYLYSSLLYNGIITISPSSPIEAFDPEDFPKTPHLREVTYNLNLCFSPDKQGLFNQILNPTYYFGQCKDEALRLWKKIAVEECIEYLNYQLRCVRFDFTPGPKTYQTFEILLNDFSVSQIYGIIWKSVADASRLCLERKFSKLHAANSVIGACARYGERAKANGWKLVEYGRLRDLPQSELAAFFFCRVLGIGDKGFKMTPSII